MSEAKRLSRFYHRHQARHWSVGSAVVLALGLSGCAHQDEKWEERNEVADTVEQISATAIRNYSPDYEAESYKDQYTGDKQAVGEYETIAAELGDGHPSYLAGAANKLYDIQRDGDRIELTPRYRGDDLAGLGAGDKQELRRLLAEFKDKTDLKVDVTGHANNLPLSGRAKSQFGDNTGLSQERARIVAEFIAGELGLSGAAISHRGVGDSSPIASNTTANGRHRNRRVEVIFRFQSRLASSVHLGPGVPDNYTPWWQEHVTSALHTDKGVVFEDVESLYIKALESSNQIKVFSDLPLIRETAILEAEGRFDPHLFMEARLRHADEPVGSTLRTGGPNRFKENEFQYTAGLRKRLYSGGEIEVSQRLGTLDNNSVFFEPDDQAQTRFTVSLTQPLLHGGGFAYNRNSVRVAKIDHDIALDEFQRQVESHLLEVARAYWSVYLERAALLIKTRLVERTESLATELQSRRGIDAIESQIAKARAAVAARRSELIRAGHAVRNAESRVVALVNHPDLRLSNAFEIVTRTPPTLSRRVMSPREASSHAIQNRPEIAQAVKQLRAGMVRLRLSENELLPVLDFIVGVSWDGLEGDRDVGGSLGSQFENGGPSVDAGLIFDLPLGNRSAKARHQRRRIEVRQLTNQLRTTIETLLLETQVSVREVTTAYEELNARYQALQASQAEIDSLQSRSELTSYDGGSGSALVSDLLAAQERLSDAEFDFLNSVVIYNVALVSLDRSMGVLMQTHNVNFTRQTNDDGLPSLLSPIRQ